MLLRCLFSCKQYQAQVIDSRFLAYYIISMKMAEDGAVPELRPFIPEIISRGGGGITLSLLPEEKFESDHEALDCFPCTTLSLRLSDSRVYNPMPLQCCYPQPQAGGKRKRRDDVVRSIEEFPKLVQALGGSRPVFLYRKKLEGSDVRGDLNRLFLTKRAVALREFLNAGEAAAVDESARGLRVVGLDAGGNSYNLGMKKWSSLNMTVINSDWNKLVAANNAEKGDFVQIWGFRRNHGELGLAIVFD